MFFQLLSTIKVNLVAKIMQSAYLCVIFHVKHKKLPFLAVYTWFLIPGKIQDGGQDDHHCCDVAGLQHRHHPWKIRHLVKKIKGFLLKVKSFHNTATYQKLEEGVPSPPLYHGGGMNLRVRPRVNALNVFLRFYKCWLGCVWRVISYTLFGNVKLRDTKLSFPALDVVYVSVSNFISYSYASILW